MKRIILVFVLVSTLLSACGPQAPAGSSTERSIALEDCVLRMGRDSQLAALCGSLGVPENPAEPQGRQIDLNIAVIPAISRTPEPDPLFLLAGGPGQSAVESFPALLNAFYLIHESRDIVLVDQRGTGESNPLRCLGSEDEALEEDEILEKLKTCPERLDADLRFYTTEIAMSDLEAVRAALGYDQINLYGVSYGTRAALTYLRLFPERVRTVTLDAVVDPGFVLYEDMAEDGQAALERFFDRCAGDVACSETFPNLRGEFDVLLARLDAQPIDLSIRHPITAEPLDLTLTRDSLASIVFNTLYSPDLAATLPLSIHTAYTDDNFVPLVSQAYMMDAGLYDGMFYAVACSEDAPLLDNGGQPAGFSEGSVFNGSAEDFLDTCAAWPRGQVSPGFRAPLVSDVPVLVLSGDADPITPPRHAEQAVETLGNSLHLVFSDMGHGNLANPCSLDLVNDFIEAASVEGLDASCVANVRPPSFFVNFSGPRP